MNRQTHLHQVTLACPDTDGQISVTLDQRARLTITIGLTIAIDGRRYLLGADGGQGCRRLLGRLVAHVASKPDRLDPCLNWLAAVERHAIDARADDWALHYLSGLRYDLVSEVVDVRHIVPDTIAA